MALCAAQVTSNANSKLCRIDLVSNNVHMPSTDRMELIGRIVDEYRSGTAGSVESIRSSNRVDGIAARRLALDALIAIDSDCY